MAGANQSTEQFCDVDLARVIQQLVDEAKPDEYEDRREAARVPFHRPVRIILNDGATVLSAFSRDISPLGIGVIHDTQLPTGEVVVEIPRLSGEPLRVPTEIHWCKAVAPGWYSSGGQFC